MGCRFNCRILVGSSRPTATTSLPTPAPLDRLPISVPTLEPDVLAPWTINSWLTGKDPMDAVTALVDKIAKESALP